MVYVGYTLRCLLARTLCINTFAPKSFDVSPSQREVLLWCNFEKREL
jgi:hypothetical protein